MRKFLKSTKKHRFFYGSFFITLIIVNFIFFALLTDYRCRKSITGDQTLPVYLSQSENETYINFYCFGKSSKISLKFIEI